MSLGKSSSGSSVTIKSIPFPKEFTSYKTKNVQCYLRTVGQGKSSPVHSADLGRPGIMSVPRPVTLSSSIKTSSSGSCSKTTTRKSTRISTSRNLIDTQHKTSVQPKRIEFMPPCVDSVVLGAPKPFIGACPINNSAAEQIASKKLFTLTEDPRKRFCLRNPKVLHFKSIPAHEEVVNVRELVKTAENLVTDSGSQSTISSICEVIDLTNPLNLDFQGMDYKNTYGRDEQTSQNQMEYRKVRRFKHRRNVKAETIAYTEREQQAERIAIPKHYAVENFSPIEKSVEKPKPDQDSYAFGKLIRAEQKPEVKSRLKQEDQNRRDRYKELYLRKQTKLAEHEEKEKEKVKAALENNARMLAEKDIQDLIGLLDRTTTAKKRQPRQIAKRGDYPHTLTETLKFRHQLKKSKRIIRDRGKVKQEFYNQTWKPKVIPEAQLEISSESPTPSPRDEEASTNDEDDMVVGQRGSKFLLRGFLYKLGTNIRGKFHQKELTEGERKVKGCITRAEWFETLVSKKKFEGVAEKPAPGMELFPQALGIKPLIASSPIKKFRNKPIGRHYDRVIRKNLRLKKPRHMKVKKFNLIGYVYGIGGRKRTAESVSSFHEALQPGQTLEYMRNSAKIERLKKRMKKRMRMHYLGIPCPQRQRKRTKSACVNSNSGDSDWIPDDEGVERLPSESIDLRTRGNMPAPEYRETTLRRHPRHPRDYKQLRVPSEVFDEFLNKHTIPVMKKLKDDKYVVENVRAIKNTEYGRKFEARHHHDHWIPTQHKIIHVRYARKIVKPKPVDLISKQVTAQLPKTFDKARPRGNNLEDINFAMPKLNTDELIKEYTCKSDAGVGPKTRFKQQSIPQSKDFVFHSMPEGELEEFPGREKFLQFLFEIKAELDKRAGLADPELAIDKTAYLNELKEDLRSIESCLSSLSSSECTNLTNDSGSFLMAGEKKIPLDYLRKSLVPFEEMNRSRFEAVPIDPAKEEMDPYRTVPFAGQEKEQLIMTAAKDSFFTFNTRLQNGLRLRLEVKQEDPRKKLLGARGGVKAPAQVATDIDELYIEDLRKRPPFKLFKWNSCRTMIKDALRKKFESMLIQGEIVRTKIYDRRNENYFEQMMQMKTLFEKLFAKWEKKEYEAAMEVVHKVKPYYEATDKYRQESYELAKQYTVLNMEIVYIENDWMRRTILQNFHYLLAEMEWRVEHDWIHRSADGELEGFEESIAKRNTTNIRQRDKDDAWAIKEYYENVYLQNYHPNIVVFQNAKDFMSGIEKLKVKTFVLLLELHYTLWILAELDQKYQEFSDWCVVELESKKTYAENKCANKYFMEARAHQLKGQVDVFLDKPIEETFSDKRMSQIKGVCQEVYKDIVPPTSQMDVGTMDQVAMISEVLTELLGKLEFIPVERRRMVEKKYRRLLAYRRNMSKQAVVVERRIASEMVKVRRNLAPPFQKPKRVGKLPRSELKKSVRVVPPKPAIISEKTKFFYRAFHEEGDIQGFKEARESLDVMDTIQESIVPFYFDHFLSINGYQPNYNFKTQVELRDGPELERFQVKSLIPDVQDKFEKWLTFKKRIMEDTIAANPKMYQNVQI